MSHCALYFSFTRAKRRFLFFFFLPETGFYRDRNKTGNERQTRERQRGREREEGNKAINGTWGFPFCRIDDTKEAGDVKEGKQSEQEKQQKSKQSQEEARGHTKG